VPQSDIVAVHWANRTQGLLEALLGRSGLSLDAMNVAGGVAETQGDLAAMIAIGEAECGLGIAAAAGGLDFLPLWLSDCFDLVLRRRDYFEPPVQALLAFTRTDAFARQAEFLGGYDTAGLGEVRFNA
jgi:putative molybdopterin biosynthesis protein